MTLPEVLAALQAAGWDSAEVYAKRGRSRRTEWQPRGGSAVATSEAGWAVRAGQRRGGWFFAATGEPRVLARWPEASGPAVRLPDVVSGDDYRSPADLEAPLLAENDARGLLEALVRELRAELPQARVLRAVLAEGTSESELISSRGIDARWRSRAALLRLEATAAADPRAYAVVELAERQAQSFAPSAIARRLADRLHVLQAGQAPERDRGEFLLAPAIGARLLLGLLPLFVGPAAPGRLQRFQDRRGKVAASALSVVDDGRLGGGVLSAPVDGEGVPTREAVLIGDGEARASLLAWWQERAARARPIGCSRRAGWRDLPAPGPTHLFVRPRADISVASLLGGVGRGYYLLDTVGAGRFDIEGDQFSLPVCGFAVQGGRSVAPMAQAWLCGAVSAFLHGVQAVARDLTLFPLDGMIGAPTLLVNGLELRSSP